MSRIKSIFVTISLLAILGATSAHAENEALEIKKVCFGVSLNNSLGLTSRLVQCVEPKISKSNSDDLKLLKSLCHGLSDELLTYTISLDKKPRGNDGRISCYERGISYLAKNNTQSPSNITYKAGLAIATCSKLEIVRESRGYREPIREICFENAFNYISNSTQVTDLRSHLKCRAYETSPNCACHNAENIDNNLKSNDIVLAPTFSDYYYGQVLAHDQRPPTSLSDRVLDSDPNTWCDGDKIEIHSGDGAFTNGGAINTYTGLKKWTAERLALYYIRYINEENSIGSYSGSHSKKLTSAR